MIRPLILLATLTLPLPGLAETQATDAQNITPADVPRGQDDYHAAAAGQYRLDPMHTAVLGSRAAYEFLDQRAAL